MGKYSDDEAVESAVLAAEADYVSAQDAVRENPDDEDTVAAYKEARDAFQNARVASRGDRAGLGITAEGN